MSDNIDRVIRPGYIRPSWYKSGRRAPVYVHVVYRDGRLSLTGVEGPTRGGNAVGSCGQIDVTHIEDPAPGWTRADILKLRDVWERWHLNDTRAGTPAQTEYMRDYDKRNPDSDKSYGARCLLLKAAGLYEDNGHKYGHGWLREEVPADVLDYLRNLPASPVTPPWV